jgi:hypothetical protein
MEQYSTAKVSGSELWPAERFMVSRVISCTSSKGANIYKLSGELIGHLNASHGSEMRLDRSTDRLFLEK